MMRFSHEDLENMRCNIEYNKIGKSVKIYSLFLEDAHSHRRKLFLYFASEFTKFYKELHIAQVLRTLPSNIPVSSSGVLLMPMSH